MVQLTVLFSDCDGVCGAQQIGSGAFKLDIQLVREYGSSCKDSKIS